MSRITILAVHLALASLLVVVTGLMERAHATVIGFEDGLDPAFTYSGVGPLSTLLTPPSGYDNVAAFTGSTRVAFNRTATSPSSFFIAGSPATTFTLNSFVIAGAWGTQTLAIAGLNDGSLLFSSALGVSLTPTVFAPGWAGIDELRISIGSDFVHDPIVVGSGQHWALDNLTINEPTSSVPEPASLVLLGSGLAGLAAWRRRQA